MKNADALCSENLFLTRFVFASRRLFDFFHRRGLGACNAPDIGYGLHSVMCELFTPELSPKLFFVDRCQKEETTVLVYGSHHIDQLHRQAQQFADPTLYSSMLWHKSASKPMPEQWLAGQRLGFRLRCCPIKRSHSAQDKLWENTHSKRSEKSCVELDAYQWYCAGKAPEEVILTKEEVYIAWFKELLGRHCAVALEKLVVDSCQSIGLQRRNHNRQFAKPLQRPEVIFSGVLSITDPQAFKSLLQSGIGRHKAFGFGMLLLMPEVKTC